MAGPIQTYAPVTGRVLLSLIFVFSGVGKIFSWSETANYMSAKGMPLVPLFLLLAILFELAGGLSILLGKRARIGAALLVIFMIPATLIFHRFWGAEGFDQMEMIHFMKNLALIGGLLQVMAYGSGPYSLDSRAGLCHTRDR